MSSITDRAPVPIARRQLGRAGEVAVAVVAVAAAVALVLLLTGLRRGIGEQVTLYVDHQPPVLVGQAGARDFIAQTSVLPERPGGSHRAGARCGDAAPISDQFAMFTLHGRRVLALLIGYDRDRRAGHGSFSAGRRVCASSCSTACSPTSTTYALDRRFATAARTFASSGSRAGPAAS